MPTLVTFTRLDLDSALKDRNAQLSDSASFSTRRTTALKMALADQQDAYYSVNNPYAIRDTLSLTPILLGSASFTTSTGAFYKVALPTDAQRVQGDSILLEVSAGMFAKVSRLTLDTLIPSGTGATTTGFYETKGQIIIYAATGTITGSPTVQFSYYVNLAVPALDTDTLDIWPQDYGKLLDTTANYLSTL